MKLFSRKKRHQQKGAERLERFIEVLLRRHAHELAEKQRAAIAEARKRGHVLGASYVVNLIDPEVSDGR